MSATMKILDRYFWQTLSLNAPLGHAIARLEVVLQSRFYGVKA